MEIGRKSTCSLGAVNFCTGQIDAAFHWRGTMDVANEQLKRCARGLLKTGAPSLRNQAGRRSKPVAVGRSVSRNLNTRHSDTGCWSGNPAVSLYFGRLSPDRCWRRRVCYGDAVLSPWWCMLSTCSRGARDFHLGAIAQGAWGGDPKWVSRLKRR